MTYINTLFIQQVAVFFLFKFIFPPKFGEFLREIPFGRKHYNPENFTCPVGYVNTLEGGEFKSSLSQAPLSKDGRETLVGRVLTLLTNMRRHHVT